VNLSKAVRNSGGDFKRNCETLDDMKRNELAWGVYWSASSRKIGSTFERYEAPASFDEARFVKALEVLPESFEQL
jgi:hypothetical protein